MKITRKDEHLFEISLSDVETQRLEQFAVIANMTTTDYIEWLLFAGQVIADLTAETKKG